MSYLQAVRILVSVVLIIGAGVLAGISAKVNVNRPKVKPSFSSLSFPVSSRIRRGKELNVGMLCAELATRLESGASVETAWQQTLHRFHPDLTFSMVTDFVRSSNDSTFLRRWKHWEQDNPLYHLHHQRDTAEALSGILVATEVSTQIGAPLAEILNRVADGISDWQEAGAKRRAAQVGPHATAKLLGVLPLAALLMAGFIGINVVEMALSGGMNTLLFVVGLALLLIGNAWIRWMIHRSAQPAVKGLEPTLAMDIIAACQQNGVSLTATLQAVADASKENDLGVAARMLILGASWEEAWTQVDPKWLGLAAVLQPSWEEGASPVPLLVRGAAGQRKQQTHQAIERAEKLGVHLVLPLGICLLPAFFILGIIPVVVSTIGDLVG